MAESARLRGRRNSRKELSQSEVRGGGREELPQSEVRGGSQEELPYTRGWGGRLKEQPYDQGAMAGRVQEGLEELIHIQGQKGQP